MSRRRPSVAARLIAVPAAAALLSGAAPNPGSQPWLVVGLVFFGAAAIVLLAAVGVKMRRTPGAPDKSARERGHGTDEAPPDADSLDELSPAEQDEENEQGAEGEGTER
ncbi:hypothetical protein ACFVU2_13430 [Leifsonia sp. NPDC058194]|uniref:hypothetical protein n=1 Tax=Leifsonia sp. NPDC058194 TaxID=3346374 RepID=UPI0036D9A56B